MNNITIFEKIFEVRVIIRFGDKEVMAELKSDVFLIDSDSVTGGIILNGKKRFVLSLEELISNYSEVNVIRKEEADSYVIKPNVMVID